MKLYAALLLSAYAALQLTEAQMYNISDCTDISAGLQTTSIVPETCKIHELYSEHF